MTRQTRIFPETEQPLPTDAPPGAELVLSALKFGGGPVSPAQKRFNQLLSQTEALTSKIEATRALADAHRLVHARTLAPLEKERNALMPPVTRPCTRCMLPTARCPLKTQKKPMPLT